MSQKSVMITAPCLESLFSLTCLCEHYWDSDSGENDALSGKGHTNSVTRLTVDDSDQLVSCSMDDTVRFTDLKKKEYR